MADLGEIVRGEGRRYLQTRFVPPNQRKALRDIACCRTAAMGSVSVTCDGCSIDYRLFRSCRNRSLSAVSERSASEMARGTGSRRFCRFRIRTWCLRFRESSTMSLCIAQRCSSTF
jgi:hypothetical protein